VATTIASGVSDGTYRIASLFIQKPKSNKILNPNIFSRRLIRLRQKILNKLKIQITQIQNNCFEHLNFEHLNLFRI